MTVSIPPTSANQSRTRVQRAVAAFKRLLAPARLHTGASGAFGNAPRKARAAACLAVSLMLALSVGAPTLLAKTAQAASGESTATIQVIPEDSFIPAGYNWGINFTGVEVQKGFQHADDLAQYYWKAWPDDPYPIVELDHDGYAFFIDGSTPKSSRPALCFTGGDFKGDKIDAVVTITDWTYLEPKNADGVTTGWDEHWEVVDDRWRNFEPGVFYNPNYLRTGERIENFNFYTVGLSTLQVQVEFYYADTLTPVGVTGHSTCIDLDMKQKFGFGGAVDFAQIVAGNEHLQPDNANNMVTSLEEEIDADPDAENYKMGLVGAYFDTEPSDDVFEPITLNFVATWQGGSDTAQSFFAMTNEYLTMPNPDEEDDPDGYIPVTKTADKTEGVSVGDIVTYEVEAQVHERGVNCRNGYSYTDFEIVDVLPAEMRYVDKTGYLEDESGRRIEGAGAVVYEGDGFHGGTENTVKFEFDRDFLQDDENGMRMRGERYRFVFQAELTEYPADGALQVVNSSYALINSTGKFPSNDVVTTLLTPEWDIDKTSDAYEYEVGDIVTYTVTVTQTVDNAQCRDAIVSDNLPEGLELIPDTVCATGMRDVPEPEINGNMWSYSLDKFNFNDTLTVTYQAKTLQSANGTEVVNLASAHADNAMDANDPAEVYVNTAKLEVSKTKDYYEHYVGASDTDPGTVMYEVTLTNTKPGTVANNVVITDESLPDGLKVGRTNNGQLMAEVTAAPTEVSYRIAAEDDVHGQSETRAVEHATEPAGTGFETTVNHLPYNEPVTIAYTCYPEDSVAGWEVVNTAEATAENALPENDSEKVWVNQPKLVVDKSASLDEYEVGDFVTYHINVTNARPGTLGRNLVISDLMAVQGVELQRDSIMVYDTEGNDITESCTIHYNRYEPTFIVETHRSIVSDAPAYVRYDGGDKVECPGPNPLNEGTETSFWVDYTVAITNRELAGQTIGNTALAVTDEPNTNTTDDELVLVKGAKLDIDKRSDKDSYVANETAVYTLRVTEDREGETARNIVLKDKPDDPALAKIVEGSVAIIAPDGEPVSCPVTYLKDDDGNIVGWEAETGISISGDDAIVATYEAVLPKPAETVGNKAQASSENAVGAVDDHEVEVVEKTEDTDPPASDDPDDPGNPDDPEDQPQTDDPDDPDNPDDPNPPGDADDPQGNRLPEDTDGETSDDPSPADDPDPAEDDKDKTTDNPIKGIDKTGDDLGNWLAKAWPWILGCAILVIAAIATIPRLAKAGDRKSLRNIYMDRL